MNARAIIVVLFGAAGCATVPSGFGGVLVTAHGVDPEPVGEGAHVVPPFGHIDVYDLRGQERDEDLIAVTADGAPVAARASLVTYRLAGDELSALERELGPGYYDVVVRPIVSATVRRVLAGARADELDTPTIRRLQQEITTLAAARVRPYHVILESVDLRTLAVLLSPGAYGHLLAAGVLEQRLQATPQRLEVARRRGDAQREAARAIAAAHDKVAPTLTREVLADDARRAAAALLAAPTTEVVVGEPTHPVTLEVEP